MTTDPWATLLTELRALHARLPVLRDFCPFPEPITRQAITPHVDPLCAPMQDTAALPAPGDLLPLRDALQTAAETAHWRDTYRDTGFGVTLHAHFGTFELIGRDTPLGARGMRSFVVYQAPGFHYPMHHHPAEELYLVIAGEGEFHLEGHDPRRLRPGESAYHPSNAPHALTTCDNPVLAYVLWRGDLTTKPVWSDPEALP